MQKIDVEALRERAARQIGSIIRNVVAKMTEAGEDLDDIGTVAKLGQDLVDELDQLNNGPDGTPPHHLGKVMSFDRRDVLRQTDLFGILADGRSVQVTFGPDVVIRHEESDTDKVVVQLAAANVTVDFSIHEEGGSATGFAGQSYSIDPRSGPTKVIVMVPKRSGLQTWGIRRTAKGEAVIDIVPVEAPKAKKPSPLGSDGFVAIPLGRFMNELMGRLGRDLSAQNRRELSGRAHSLRAELGLFFDDAAGSTLPNGSPPQGNYQRIFPETMALLEAVGGDFTKRPEPAGGCIVGCSCISPRDVVFGFPSFHNYGMPKWW